MDKGSHALSTHWDRREGINLWGLFLWAFYRHSPCYFGGGTDVYVAVSYAMGIWEYLTYEEEQRGNGKQTIKKSVCSVCHTPTSRVLPSLPKLRPLTPGFA